jgi:bacillopeptidase F (M6 metalloprotease family)
MKWQYDKPFVKWLVEQQYAESKDGKIVPHTSLGLVLYMHEAYRAGFENRKQNNGTLFTR